MEMNENFVEQAENVVQTTEETATEPAKLFTQEDMNAAVGKAKARERAKVEKKYEKEYGGLLDVLKAGTGKDNVVEMADTFRDFYQRKGITIPQKPTYSDKDVEVLARADADDIIRSGYDEVEDELKRLTDIGFENMTAREKAVFKTLAEHRNEADRGRQLSKIGVTEEEYNSAEFKAFASKFAATTPITEVFEIYSKQQPKKNIQTMGSMKNSDSTDSAIKDFYTRDEALKFTKKDFDKNPALFKAVCESMQKW